MLIGVICILAAIIIAVVIVIFVKARNDEIDNYYSAARNILKEDKLDDFLRNPHNGGSRKSEGNIRPMIFLKFRDKSKSRFVFDLSKEIYIGRDKDENQVCVNEAIVSHQHCRIFLNGANVFIQDLNSSNGLEVKRGITSYTLNNGNVMEIFTKDTIKIGTTRMKIVIFYFDATLM